MANVGYATLTVSPSMRGMQSSMQRQLGGIMPAAGQRAGRQLGTAMQAGTRVGVGRMAGAMGAVTGAASRTAGAIRERFTAATGAARSGVDSIGSSFRGMAGMAAAFTAGMGLVSMVGDIRDVAAGAQNAEAVLDGLYQTAGHGAGEAQRMMRALNDEFGRSGIAMPAWQQGAMDLAWLGLNARETTSLMKFLDDAITATGGGADEVGRVTSALATMQNMGKASLNEINMLSQSGIPIFDMMTAHLGMTNDEFAKAVSNGEILVDDVLAAIEAKGGTWASGLIDGAENVNRTWSSAWDAMRSTIVNGIAMQLVPLLDRAAPKILKLGDMVGSAFDALPGALSRLKGAMDQYGITDALRTMYDAALALARGAGPVLSGFATGFGVALGIALLALGPVADLLADLGRWMQNNEGVVRNFGIALGGVAAALLLIKGAAAIGGAIAALATPIGWVTLLIAGLTAGITYAWRESATFRSVVVGAWRGVQRAIETGVAVVTGVIAHLRDETTLLGGIWQTVWAGAKRAFDVVWKGLQAAWLIGQQIFQGLWDVIAGVLEGDWGRAWTGAKDAALGAWDLLWIGLKTTFGLIWSSIRTFFVELPRNVRNWLSENGPAILEGLTTWWETVKNWIIETTPKILSQLSMWGTAIGDWLATEAPKKIMSGAQKLWNNHLKPWFEDLPNKITRAVDRAQRFQEWFSEYGPTLLKGLAIAIAFVILGIPALILLVGAAIIAGLAAIAGSITRSLTTHLRNAASEAFLRMRQTAVQRVNDFLAWLRGLPNRAGAALGGMSARMMQVGRDIISGIIRGVGQSAGRLYGNLRNLARNALNAAKNALGISSPSRVFRDEVGGEIVAGLLAGVDAGRGQVDRALADLVSARPAVGQVRVPVSAEVSQHAAAQQRRAATAQQEQMRTERRSADLLERLLAAVRAQGDGSVVIEVDSKEIARANRKGEHSLARR